MYTHVGHTMITSHFLVEYRKLDTIIQAIHTMHTLLKENIHQEQNWFVGPWWYWMVVLISGKFRDDFAASVHVCFPVAQATMWSHDKFVSSLFMYIECYSLVNMIWLNIHDNLSNLLWTWPVFIHVIHNLANVSKKIPNCFNDPATAPHHPDGLLALSTAEQSVEMCKALGSRLGKLHDGDTFENHGRILNWNGGWLCIL